ncbi:MAG TPA: DUF302 domain-containing protein [Leucothrix mucor]|uniref:DUF302 domain-containing protein n=1 Tax=Leucothrix mucor TaxID=45248 RepID=A0A7V2WVX1_LEUMU|nr:DUF302 domain-containing protein [Leucothrix mucor]
MKNLFSIILLSLVSLTVFAGSAEDTTKNDVIKKVSPYSVGETMDKFEAIVKKKGFDIFARIDHKKNAQGAKMEMNPAQVLIFGNPKGGTVLMKQDISVALDLPLRVAVYKDADGKVIIAYHNPVAMTAGYNLKEHKVIAKVTKGLDKLTSVAIAKE